MSFYMGLIIVKREENDEESEKMTRKEKRNYKKNGATRERGGVIKRER